jgi:uncharacterized membrane protein
MIEQGIEVDVPVRTAYDQWTQFEEFPAFMDGVEEVRQIDDTHLHWVVQIAGQRREWDAEITEQRPDERVAWKSTDGKDNAGVVTFHRLGENRTRIMVQMAHDAEGILESVGSALNLDERRVKADLERFKELIERRGVASGAWRGEVQGGDTVAPDSTERPPSTAIGQGAASGDVISTDALAPDEPGRLA